MATFFLAFLATFFLAAFFGAGVAFLTAFLTARFTFLTAFFTLASMTLPAAAKASLASWNAFGYGRLGLGGVGPRRSGFVLHALSLQLTGCGAGSPWSRAPEVCDDGATFGEVCSGQASAVKAKTPSDGASTGAGVSSA